MFGKNTMLLTQPQEPTAQVTSVPASVGGVNALQSLMQMPGEDCIYTYNMMPVEYGMRLRKGYREWATGVTSDVRTLINYESDSSGTAEDRLWAVSEFGIYNVTLFNTIVPDHDVIFSVQGDAAGYGVKCEFTSDASEHYLFYADGLNGLHQYTSAAGWSIPTSGIADGEWFYIPPGGVDPADRVAFPVEDIAFVMVHKLRIWVILENSSDAWYLPIASVSGLLTKFTFGAKMDHGGNLQGLWTWTLDGGDGVDDYMVGLSHAGDVLVYRGDDPEISPDSTPSSGQPWTIVGSWFIGEVPDSRRIALSQGSELYMLSTYGLTSLRDLMKGTDANINISSPSAKVNRFLRADVETGKNRREWTINTHPADGFMQVVTPEPSNTPYVQYNQNLSTRAWGFWEGVPMICGETWNGNYFMGGKDGVVYIYDGQLDGTTIAQNEVPGVPGSQIEWRQLTSFQGLDNHAAYKRVGFIRAIGILAGTASVNVQAVFDYQVNAPIAIPPAVQVEGEYTWDSALWDSALWDFGLTGRSIPLGAMGMGRAVAIGMSGNSSTRVTVVGWDMIYQSGGLL